MTSFIVAFLVALTVAGLAQETAPPVMVGAVFEHLTHAGDTFSSLGARFGIDSTALARSNGLAPNVKLQPDQLLFIDNRHIVPGQIDRGILVNVPQRMLFVFEQGQVVASYPVAAGRPGWETPLGPFVILTKETNPSWDVPVSIQNEMRRMGKRVVTRIGPGSDNPLGKYWIGLNRGSVGIHGTNAPRSIYHLQTHGCIRLHPDDVAALFPRVSTGMPGTIIYQPVLMTATSEGAVYLEAHKDGYRRGSDLWQLAQTLADRLGIRDRIDWEIARSVVSARDGVPHDVSIVPHDVSIEASSDR